MCCLGTMQDNGLGEIRDCGIILNVEGNLIILKPSDR